MKMMRIGGCILVIAIIWGFGTAGAGWALTAQPQTLQEPWPRLAQASEMLEGIPESRQRPTQRSDFGGLSIHWDKLELSRSQKVRILQKRRDFQVNTAAIREQLKFAEQDLREAVFKEPVDRADLDRLLQEVAALKLRLSEAAVQNLLEIKGLLSPEQITTLIRLQVQVPSELQALQLTFDQQKQVRDIIRDSIRHNREKSEKLRILRAELQELLLLSVKVNSEKVAETQKTITEHEMALEKARVEMILKLREILTPEQRRRYQQLRIQRQSAPSTNLPGQEDKKRR